MAGYGWNGYKIESEQTQLSLKAPQAIGEVRFDVVSLFQKEVKTLREEFGRARSDEAASRAHGSETN